MRNMHYEEDYETPTFKVRWKNKTETFFLKEVALKYFRKHPGAKFYTWNPGKREWVLQPGAD